MAAKMICLSATLLGATLGACWPVSRADNANDAANASQSASSGAGQSGASVSDVALEIALNQFPGGYQSRWATNLQACAEDPETSADIMSLQGRLIKFPDSLGTMVQGKRMTSKTMEAEFEFVRDGKKWTKSMAFQLSEDRQQLVRTDVAGNTRTGYVRCPKLMAG